MNSCGLGMLSAEILEKKRGGEGETCWDCKSQDYLGLPDYAF